MSATGNIALQQATNDGAQSVRQLNETGNGDATSWWSIERMLYGLALVIGLWLRLWFVGSQPLSVWEASNSWPAWLAANGLLVQDSPAPNSALYYALQWLLFWTGVNNESGARFISVVAGAVLIILPWWWRGVLGRRVALMVAFLFAIDGWLIGFSRLADGAIVALTLGMLALVGISQTALQPASVTWKRIVTISLGLLVVSGPMGWNILPIVLWWGWLNIAGLREAQLMQVKWLAWIAGAAFVGATLWFARLDSLAWIASGMSVWLSQIDGGSAGPLLPAITGGYDLWWPWLRLVVDGTPLLPLGLGGLVILALRVQKSDQKSSELHQLLYLYIGWILWGVVLFLLPGRSPLALPIMGIPLLILTAYFVDTLFNNIPTNLDWREVGAVVTTLVILVVSGVFWLAALLANKNYDPVLAQATLVIIGLAVAILVAFALWANRREALWVAITLIATLLTVVYVRSSWKLNYANVVIEPAGWQAVMAHPEVRILAGDMETLSSHRSGDPYQLPVQVQVVPYVTQDDQVIPARPDPIVGWELRNMRNLTWVTSPVVAKESDPLPLVVTPATDSGEEPQLDLPNEYGGSRYHVDSWWLPTSLTEADDAPAVEGESNIARIWTAAVQPWWRWIIYREPAIAPQNRDVILWAPLDDVIVE